MLNEGVPRDIGGAAKRACAATAGFFVGQAVALALVRVSLVSFSDHLWNI